MRNIIDRNVFGAHRLAIIRDITEEQRMAEKLLQSEKMRAIGQLAGGVAHDFNNQLAGIVGIAELLRLEVSPDERLVKYITYILSASQRAADLIGQLLAFARKGVYQPARLDLHQIIDEVVNILSHTLSKSISIKKRLDASNSIVVGDASQIQNVLTNLAINARDAMAQGGELVFCSEDAVIDEAQVVNEQKLAAGSYVKLSVIDTGEGMSEEVMAKMFEPFFTTKSADKGTGMGLASVYGTVAGHDGAISVHSQLGKGTRIEVVLPVCSESEEEKRDSSPTIEASTKKARILLVDDEPVVLTSAELSLQTLGYDVVTSINGYDALMYYRDHWKEIDLVMLDMLMPKMDGKTAYAEMKAINPNIVVLLSSGIII